MTLMTIGQVAAYHGVHKSTVVGWVDRGHLPATRDARMARQFDRDVVLAFVKPGQRLDRRHRPLCSLGDGRPHYGHGYCRAHHQRWVRTGDPQAHMPLGPIRRKPLGQYGMKPESAPKSAPRRVFDPIDTDEL